MKIVHVLCTFLFAAMYLTAEAQAVQTMMEVDSISNKVDYTVLKSNPSIKHGIYRVSSIKTTYVDGNYNYGVKQGEWTYKGPYNPEPNSDKLIVLYDSGRIVKKWSYYGLEISKVTYKNGKPDSLIRVLQDVSIVKVRLEDNFYELVKVQSATGVILLKGYLKDDKPEGEWTFYWKHGTAVQHYSNGELNGPSFSFWPEGQMQQACMYRDGLLHGSRFMFYDNGDTLMKGRYKEGRQDGVFEMRYLKNKLFTRAHYREDSLLSYECFTQSGKTFTEFKTVRDKEAMIYRMNVQMAKSPSRVVKEFMKVQLKDGILLPQQEVTVFRKELETEDALVFYSDIVRFEYWFMEPLEQQSLAEQVAFYSGYNDSTLSRLVSPTMDTIIGYRILRTKLIYTFYIDETGAIDTIESKNPETEGELNQRILFLLNRTTDFWITGSMYGLPMRFKITMPIDVQYN